MPGAEAIEGFIRAGINANWLLTGQGEMLLSEAVGAAAPPGVASIKEQEKKIDDSEFELVPYLDIEASAGNGSLIDQELQTSQMAFRRDWLIQRGLQSSKCTLIKARGDSMEPTIHDGDLLLVDRRIVSIKDDAIYIIESENHLVVKRVQQALDGSLIIISDNPRYEKQVISPERARELKITGRVRWYGHEI
ncbi:S24 family peptidase [Methylobacter marinus]|uniref:S24 family peptidase n=1 Tax=Methylobacter marinus TaxID=34058 RepID=UPI0018DE991B|nr:helix-turn-helix transcriptional regulator [Methylobacter marinus]